MTIILPELLLTMLALLSQLGALFTNKNKLVARITIILSCVIVFVTLQAQEMLGFNDSFATNNDIGIFKAIILIFTIVTMVIYKDYCIISKQPIKAEFFTLTLLSTAGIFISLSSRNFLLLFCAIELQALISYVLAGFNINSLKSSESALKYFILGALISCLSLFGISFIYGFGGNLEFYNIFQQVNNNIPSINIGLIIGLILFLCSILFKLSAVPLHFWAPDVYEGSPISSVTYFSTVSKIGMVGLLLNILIMVIGDYRPITVNLIKIISILSMLVGALGAIRQNSLKRLMAYSTILNVGYVLLGLSLHNEQGNYAAIVYMIIYAASITGFFACLIALLGSKADDASFEDIKGVGARHKALSIAITIIMFSMIGIPPLAGFLGKYYLFYQAISSQEFLLAFSGILTSVISAYYYLKIIKTMYFVETVNIYNTEHIPVSLPLIITIIISFILFAGFLI